MARVSKEVLKSFFQKGSKPSEAHFTSLVDSLVHYASDRDLLGLKNYNPNQSYSPGDTVIFNDAIYEALNLTTGVFVAENWNKILSSNGGGQSEQYSLFGSEYETVESSGQSFMSSALGFVSKLTLNTGSRSGKYRIQWSAVVNHQQEDGMGKFRLMNVSSNEGVGVTLVHKQSDAQQKTQVGGIALVDLNGTSSTFEIQYQTLNDGMRQYIEQARIEIFKVSGS